MAFVRVTPLLPPALDSTSAAACDVWLFQAEKAELKSALLETVASALFYNPQITLSWTEANNATQVVQIHRSRYDAASC